MVDLTRELKKQGFDVKLYSFVPPKCAKSMVYVMKTFTHYSIY